MSPPDLVEFVEQGFVNLCTGGYSVAQQCNEGSRPQD